MLMLITIIALTKTVTRVKKCWQVALFSLQPFNWNGSRERVQKNSMKKKKKQTKQQRKSVQVPKRNHIEQYFLNLD